MKKQYYFIMTALMVTGISAMTSCISSQSLIPVKGNGMPVEKSFDVSGFEGIEVSGGFDVILTQGNEEKVVLSAQENLYNHIRVDVSQGVLRIYTEGNLMPTKPLKAMITFRDINHLDVSGGGDVTAQTPLNVKVLGIKISGGGDLTSTLSTDDLSCRISGGGDARLSGRAGKYTITMSGGGDLESNLEATSVNCVLSGGGDLTMKSQQQASEIKIELTGGGDADASVNATRMLCSVSGGGNLMARGKADELDVHLGGGGDLNASSLETAVVSFQANGGSDLYLQASKEIKGTISGGGDVYYSGSAVVSIDTHGGSEVHKQ